MSQIPQRRHCWKCNSRHSKPTGFKCTRAKSVMDSGLNALPFGSTSLPSASWSTFGLAMTTASTHNAFGSTHAATAAAADVSSTVSRSTQDTTPSLATGMNTAVTTTTTTTTTTSFNGSHATTVLCTATSTRPSAPCPVSYAPTQPSPSVPTPSVPLVQSSHLGAPSVPVAAGLPAQGVATTDLAATLQSLTSVMASMNARMQVLESAATANPRLSVPATGPPHVGLPFLPYSDTSQHLPSGAAPVLNALSAATHQVPGPTGAIASAPAPIPASLPSVAERARRELVDIQFASDSSSTSSSDSDAMVPRRKTKRKSHRVKSGRGRTTDDFVARRVPWPHHGVYKGQARKAARYDTLSIPEFVFGYLGHATKHDLPPTTQAAMLAHLRELMHDASIYPWEGVRNYHGILLGMMEQNELTWADRPLIQELRLQYARQPSSAHTPHYAQAQAARHPPCASYQSGACPCDEDHASEHGTWVSHICAWCHRVRNRAHQHPESACYSKRRRASKNGAAEPPQ